MPSQFLRKQLPPGLTSVIYKELCLFLANLWIVLQENQERTSGQTTPPPKRRLLVIVNATGQIVNTKNWVKGDGARNIDENFRANSAINYISREIVAIKSWT